MATALVVIDMHQALCSGEWAAFDIGRVMENINALSARARPAGAPVLFVQHEEADGPLQFGGASWQLAEGLHALPQEPRIRKATPDSFLRTPLDDMLRALGATHLIVCGLQSDCCIDSTVRRALALGFDVTLVEDGHSTVDNGVLAAAQIIAHHNAILSGMTSFGPRIRVVKAGDVVLP